MAVSITLSIIIPAYNAEPFIQRVLSCLLEQNTEEIEIIVVNDGSNDGTLQAAERAASGNALRNTAIYTKENGGVSSARNFGLDKARGDYVFFLDADDYVSMNFVEALLQLIDENRADVIHWPYDLVNESGKTILSFPYRQAHQTTDTGLSVLRAILFDKSTRIWTGSAAYRRAALCDHHNRYTEGCAAGEDLEFILTALMNARTVLFSDRPRSFYVQQPNSVMSSYSIKKFSAVEAMERVGVRFLAAGPPEYKELARHMDDYEALHSYAGTYTMCLRHLVAVKHMRSAAAKARLAGDIEEMYPGLHKRMMVKLGARKKRGLPDRLDIFRLSPVLYMRLSNFRQPAMPR